MFEAKVDGDQRWMMNVDLDVEWRTMHGKGTHALSICMHDDSA